MSNKKKEYNNISFTYQPNFNTRTLRPLVSEQKGNKWNFVVVTCSETYNGVYKYPASKTKEFDTWGSGRNKRYIVPISDCEKIKELNQITNKETLTIIKEQQSLWLNGELPWCKEKFDEKPDWML